MVVTELRVEEKEMVKDLLVASYKQYEYTYKDRNAWKRYLHMMLTSVDNPDVHKIFVVKSKSEIVGTIQLFLSAEKAYGKPELEIDSPIIRLLAVHPNARGLGVAQALLNHVIRYVQSLHETAIYLHTTDSMEKAIQLYERYNFQRDQSKEFESNGRTIKCYRLDL